MLARAEAAGVRALLAIGIGDGPATMGRASGDCHGAAPGGTGDLCQCGHSSTGGRSSLRKRRLGRLRNTGGRSTLRGRGRDWTRLLPRQTTRRLSVQHAAFKPHRCGSPTKRASQSLSIAELRSLPSEEAKEKFGTADAWEDLLRLLSEHWPVTGNSGIMHCFSGTKELAQSARWKLGSPCPLRAISHIPSRWRIREAAVWAPAETGSWWRPTRRSSRRSRIAANSNEPALVVTHTAVGAGRVAWR